MRVHCKCGSHLFYLQVPPDHTPEGLRFTYLICEECRKIWTVKFDRPLEVDAEGNLKPEKRL